MKNDFIFITSTMFSRTNGPANFAMNLFSDRETRSKLLFLTSDIKEGNEDVIKVNNKFATFFKPLAMIFSSLDFYLKLKKINFSTAIWNSSILSIVSICLMTNKKHIVFVNDSLSLDVKFKFQYRIIRLWIFKHLEMYTVKKAEKVITNSKIIKEKIIKKYDINASKIHVLYKGLYLSEISEFKINFEIDVNKKINITFVKSDPVVGGLMILCETLARLKYNFKINVIGPSYLNQKYYNFTNVSINHLGRLQKKSVYKTLIKSDLFMVPCLNEAFGQANIEAMYSKTPTIIMPTIFQKQLHDSSYCYFPQGLSIRELSETVSDLIQLNSIERERKSNIAHLIVEEKFSFLKTKIEFIQIIND